MKNRKTCIKTKEEIGFQNVSEPLESSSSSISLAKHDAPTGRRQ